MHVAIFTDIEGCFGIWRMRQCRTGTRQWQYGRACLTQDVNHLIQGALEGGADRVTVKDTHVTGFNCLINRLDRRAHYVGGHFTRPTFFGNVSDYDLVLYVGIHAAAGTPDAFFPHTHFGVFSQVLLNGEPASEMDIYGGYLGEYGVPVGLVSGDAAAIGQARARMPWIETVEVDKRKEIYTAGQASTRYLKEGRAKLTQAAARAVDQAQRMQPLKWAPPLRFEARFRNAGLANRFNTWRFEQDDSRVFWEAGDMIEGFDAFNRLTFLPRRLYPFRHVAIGLIRTFHRVRSGYFAPRPDSEGAASTAD